MDTEHAEGVDEVKVNLTGGEEPPKVKEQPFFLQDVPPRGKKKFCQWALMHGKTEAELETEGFNPGTVRIAAYELEKIGQRKRVKDEGGGAGDNSLEARTRPPGKDLQIFAKGSPPEALINSIIIPIKDGEVESFEQGLKFGANMIVLGVRVAQELSNLGVQQARPLIDMARDMRTGEAAAAKSAASEAAMLAAAQVQQGLMPYLAGLSKGGESDPMRSMISRVMEPMFGRIMGSVIPGASGALPGGWTKKTE